MLERSIDMKPVYRFKGNERYVRARSRGQAGISLGFSRYSVRGGREYGLFRVRRNGRRSFAQELPIRAAVVRAPRREAAFQIKLVCKVDVALQLSRSRRFSPAASGERCLSESTPSRAFRPGCNGTLRNLLLSSPHVGWREPLDKPSRTSCRRTPGRELVDDVPGRPRPRSHPSLGLNDQRHLKPQPERRTNCERIVLPRPCDRRAQP